MIHRKTGISAFATGLMLATAIGLGAAQAAPIKIDGVSSDVAAAASTDDLMMVGGQVNGANVKKVFHAGGRFVDRGNGKWEERGNDGAKFNFRETNRDEWSVYLTDDSRGVNLQLDLHTKMIYYSDANTPRRPQYEITKADAGTSTAKEPAGVNGRSVRVVKYPGGAFRHKGGGKWIEKNKDGKHNFRETNRDDWSVYLSDDSRGVNIQLDLHRKEIFYSDGNTAKRVQYKITSAKN